MTHPVDPDSNHRRAALSRAARREFLLRSGAGLGSLALSALLGRDAAAAQAAPAGPAAPTGPAAVGPARAPHFAPKAKSIIWLFMNGGPSQLDLLDPKPALAELDGQPVPESFTRGERFAFIKGTPLVLRSPYEFARHGECGAEVSGLLPEFARIVDKVSIVALRDQRGVQPRARGTVLEFRPGPRGPAQHGFVALLWAGQRKPRPAGFVVLLSGGGQPSGGNACWSSGFLPTVHQGVQLRSSGDPVLFVEDPEGLGGSSRRASLDLLRELNTRHLERMGDPEIATRIANYELAYRMQSSVPELMDIASEPESVRAEYGVEPGTTAFANNCLLARRLVERGVRFVQLYHRGWDHHGTGEGDDLVHSLPLLCRATDRAAAALVLDLERRGLLDTTLVIWGGEFGRTPMNERRNGSTFLGRDHHPHASTMWFAGGGVKRGVTLGETDEIGYRVTRDPLSVHDLHATLLALLGLDHKGLTYRHQGRDFRLTDVSGELFAPLIA
jgi:hypothetical protein